MLKYFIKLQKAILLTVKSFKRLMSKLELFLEKVKNDIRGGECAYVVFNGEDFKSIRQTSSNVENIRFDHLVGVYDKNSTDFDIIDDCLDQISIYEQRKKNSTLLNQKMTS